jgi:predicted permease
VTAVRVWLSRAFEIITRRRREARLSEEIDAHLDLLVDDFVGRGMSREAARTAARRAFGGVDQVKAVYRDQRGIPAIESLLQDLKCAVRMLAKDRGFTAATASALALGIGVTTTVFTILNAMNLRDLPVDRAEQIMALRTENVAARQQITAVSYPDFRDWQAASRTFSGLAAYVPQVMNVGDEARPADRFGGAYLTANAFDLLRVRPLLGRGLQPNDDRPGAPAVVLLSHGAWLNRYGADPAIIGSVVRVNGVPATVVGVMPEGFRFPLTQDVWQPLSLAPGLARQDRDVGALAVFGRLSDGSTLDEARAEFGAIAMSLGAGFPTTNRNRRVKIVPFREPFGSITDPVPLLLMTAVAFVLLIACANASNLLLARSAHRAREVALRTALGASRARIVRQLLVESTLLAAIAGVIGLGIAVLAVRAFALQTDGLNLPYWMTFTFDGRVFGFLTTICLATGVLFGLAPSWHVSRTNAGDVLKDGGRAGGGSVRARRWTGALLVAQFALTIVLLGGAGLLIRSSIAIYRADVVDASNLLTARLSLPQNKYPTAEHRAAFYQRLEERLSQIPAIAAAALTTNLPFTGGARRLLALGSEEADGRLPEVRTLGVTSRYFETLGLTLVRGHTVSARVAQPTPTIVVNTRFVEVYMRDRDPVGQRIRLTDASAPAAPPVWATIVGVAPTIRQSPMVDREPVIYTSLVAQPVSNFALMARGVANSEALGPILREEVLALDSDLPLFNSVLLSKISEMSRFTYRVGTSMLTLFAAIAVWLSAMGLYAMTSYRVSQRTQEIGVRMALGAAQPQVVALFLRGVLVQLLVGLGVGLAGAVAVGRLIQGLLVQTSGADPVTFAAVALFVVGVAVSATIVPARRASALDPVAALRHE